MDAERRAQWVTALRSGKYGQARGVLRDNGNLMCCLGVAINEFCPNNWATRNGMWADRGEDIMLPTDATREEQLGLTTDEVSTLADLNDAYELSFSEIANHIARNDDLSVDFDERDREAYGGSSRTH